MSPGSPTRAPREQAGPGRKPVAHRVTPVLTLLVAVAWVVAASHLADHVGTVNFARGLGAAMTGALIDRDETEDADPPLDPLLSLFPPVSAPAPTAPKQPERVEELRRQILYVEGILFVWRAVMYLVAGVLLVVGLTGCFTRRVRGPHLAAAVLVLLSVPATVVAMELLAAEDKGGLGRLSLWTYLLVAVAQSLYAFVLLLILTRRRPTAPGAQIG